MGNDAKIARKLVRLAKTILSLESSEQCPYSEGQEIHVLGVVDENVNGHLRISDSLNVMATIELSIPFVEDAEARKMLKEKFFELYKQKRHGASDKEVLNAYRSISKQVLDKKVESQRKKMQTQLCNGLKSDWSKALEARKGEQVSLYGRVTKIHENDILISHSFWIVFVDMV